VNEMLGYMQRSWWIFLPGGVAAAVFGIVAYVWPAMTLEVLVLLFGSCVLVDGMVGLVNAVRSRDRPGRVWPSVLGSGLGIIGLLTLFSPALCAFVLLMFIAAWSIVGGLLRIVLAFHIRKEITGDWILVLGGGLSIVFGGLLFAMRLAGLVTLALLIGFYAIAFGVLFVMPGFRLRKLGNATGTNA